MKRLLIGTLVLALSGVSANAQEKPQLDTVAEKFSYAMGYRMVRDMMQQGIKNLDADAMAAGLRAALAREAFPYNAEELKEIMTGFRQLLQDQQSALAASNAEAGRKFLAENEKAEGVKVLDGGVQYRVQAEGSGTSPAETDTVRVHYSGKLLDGTEFDSSYQRGEPTELNLQNVIPGWRTALTAMSPGAKWSVWIPPELAYGSGGAGGLIGPNSTLSFEIELLEVVKKP